MGLKASALKLLAPKIRGARILCLSYPDILIPMERAVAEYGVPADLQTSTKGGWQHGCVIPLPETREFFGALGAEVVIFADMKAWRGVEVGVDLNTFWDLQRDVYDLVIDPGTTEHCFNVGTAIMNAASAVRVGGSIFHCPPASMVNHGFWNFSPTALHDFYTQNGWTVDALLYEQDDQLTPANPHSRHIVPPEFSLYCLATRKTAAPLAWPTQEKYRRLAIKEGK
jgi:hypothetical protein